ncbi:titin isoform X3 [Ceratitis capitata]|nr:titin isoform X3 [Ceratitis capitata]
MAGNYAKDPLNPSHGDSLVGQNFQGLKSQEVRDSMAPINDLKFHSMTLNHPNTTGWDVQTSSEVSPDGRAYRTETLATTDGVEKINGGTAEFRGRNEQRASASHQGDDKNFVKKASESSNTHLQEHVVVGDENSGRSEMKMSSTTTSSSSQVTSSSSTVEYGGAEPLEGRYITDNTNQHHQRLTQEQYNQQQQQLQRQQQLQQQEFEQTKQYQQQQHQQRVQQQTEINSNRQESTTSRNVETQQTREQSRRVVDMDKASPEYQQHVQYLMQQPGEVISNTVEYPKPNVKMITTVKRLPDGTIVKNKRYETEELSPTVESQRQRTTSTTSQSSTQQRNEQQRRQQTEENVYNRQQNVRNNVHDSNAPRRPEHDVVDNAEPFTRAPSQQQLVQSYPNENFTDEATNIETKFSSVKKSNRRFSTETTSETIEEFTDQPHSTHAPGIKGKPSPSKDFSTHGFPSVKPNKPTQEYPTERPHGAAQPDFSTHGFPSVRPNKPTQEYPSDRPRPTDVEYINQRTVVDSYKASPVDAPHGFPAVRPNTNLTTTKDGDVIIVSSESTRSSKYKTNAERVIETEVVIDGDSSGRTQKLTQPENFPNRGFPAMRDTPAGNRDSPRHGVPARDYPSNVPDYSTNGFPSTRDVVRPNSAQPITTRSVDQDGNIVTVVSSETKKTIKHNTNREHIIETEVVGDNEHYTPSGLRQPDKITFPPTPQPGDFGTHGFPSVRDSAPTNDYRRQGTPTRDYPSSPRKPQPTEDFSTHGFPSVRDSAPVRGGTPSRDYPSSPRQQQPREDFTTHGFPSVRTPNKSGPDYSSPSGGYPSTKDTSAPKLTPTPPRVPQPSSTATRKSTTTTTDSSQRLISKERDVDATHRAFAASLRSSSPADSTDHHHRTTPRSSVSSTRTFRRDGREGSHDSETSRFSSGTVTRSSPSKSVGKTVVTKQTVVKTRNVNGSNETIDLTPQQRPTKSPSPTKTITTTTTRTTTTAATPRKSPAGDVPKSVYPSDNQTKSKPAANTFPTIINEPLTITKTHFTANDASFLGNEVVEEPCLKKHFYKLGPSDKATTNHADERSPYSPTAPSNHSHRTHPKTKSPVRDDFDDVNHEEPIHKQPLSSSVIEPKQRNRLPTGPSPTGSRPQTICQPNSKEPSVERRTVVRESEFENTDWQNTILNTNEKPYPVKSDLPTRHENEPRTDDEYIDECTLGGETPIDTSDYPVIREDTKRRPTRINKTETTTIESKRKEKLRTNEEIELSEECVTIKPQSKEPTERAGKKPTSRQPSETVGKRPQAEPVNRRPTEAEPTGRTRAIKKPVDSSPSPTRKIPDTTSSKITSTTTIMKTTRKDSTRMTDDDKQPKETAPKKPTDRKPSDTGKVPIHSESSPTRKPTGTFTTVRKVDIQKQPAGRKPTREYPTEPNNKVTKNESPERSPTRRTTERAQIITKQDTRKVDSYSVEDYEQSEEPELDDVTYTTRTTIKTVTREGNASPSATYKQPKDSNKRPLEERPIKPCEKQSPFSKSEIPIPSDEESTPTGGTPESKVVSEKTTESMDIKSKKTQLTTTTVKNIPNEKYQPGPKSKPSKPEYSDMDDEQGTLQTIEKITIETNRTKKPHPNIDYDVYVYENGKQPEDELVPNEPLKSEPSARESNGKPKQSFKTIDSQVEQESSDTENVRTSFLTTQINKIVTDETEPIQLTHRTTYDENKRVKELFSEVDDTNITKNVNEEFITFEREVRDRDAPTENSFRTTTSQPEHSEPITKRMKPLGDRKTQPPQDLEPSRPFEREPKSKPADKQPLSVHTGDNETTFTDLNTLKTTSVTTTVKRDEQERPYAPEQPRETKQSKVQEPKELEPSGVDLGDTEEDSVELFGTTTTIITKKTTRKDDLLTTVDDEERDNGVPDKKKPDDEKPSDSGPNKQKPLKTYFDKTKPNDTERKPSPTGKTLETITITTSTVNMVGEKPYPEDIQQPSEPFDKLTEKNLTSDETKRVEELFKTTTKSKYIEDHNEEFIAKERRTKETPDGAFISKAPEPEPSSPSFRKKGVSPRETFEDRCRQILGMENYGDTPGTYTKRPENVPAQKEPITANVTEFEVKIEDCEDDEPNYLNNIKESIKPQKKEPSTTFDKPQKYTNLDISDEDLVEEVECVRTDTVVPFKRSSPEPTEAPAKFNRKTTKVSKKDINEEDNEHIVSKTTSKLARKGSKPTPKKEKLGDDEPEETSSSESEIPEKETDEESQPDTVVSKRDMRYTEEIEIEENTNLIEIDEKQQPVKSAQKPGKSPTRKPSEPEIRRKTSPLRPQPSGPSTVTNTIESKTKTRDLNRITKVVNETKPTMKSADSPDKHFVVKKDKPASPTKPHTERIPSGKGFTTPTKKQQKPNDSPTSTIKDRLRSATRNRKPSETESESSLDGSPTRHTERRRSSNISVHTEIIIDHTAPKSPKPDEKTPEKHTPSSKKATPINATSPTRPFRRFPVTERKESAPVPSVTRKDKDAKMTRSTSEKVMKVTEKPLRKTDLHTLAPSPTPKVDKRPNKCFTTKTINLSTSDKLINSEEMENVIIDIQHAKSSREPSPDKIIPTPVPVHLDTGKPRYPDVVQEPEDEPRKKPVITNIPIFEEDSNEYIQCHISEVQTKLIDLKEDDILDNPTIEAPKSLDYPSIDKPDDDCLLSVHEKVSKFTHTAEEIKKPKASSPFSREFDKTPLVPENDECLLTVDEKVSKFIKTAEEVSKPITPLREVERPSYTDLDEELQRDDCTLSVSQKVNKFLSTAEKLAPTAPQRSPELVAKIERTISKQSEPEYPEGFSDDELTPFSQNHTIELEKRRQKDILSRPSVFENTTKIDQRNNYTKEEVTTVKSTTIASEFEEVIPHTRDHTTKIELKRQKDILSRPSIYDKSSKPRPQSPNKREPTSPTKKQQPLLTNTKQVEYTAKRTIAQDNEKFESRNERKPSTPTIKQESRKSPTKPSTVAVTRSHFEPTDNKKAPLKNSIEPKTDRLPSTLTNGRKPVNEPKPIGRKPSSDSITNSSYPSRCPAAPADHQSPQGRPRKPATEPDSHYPNRKPFTESEKNTRDYETIESETEFTTTTRRRSSSKTKDYLETVQTEIERFSPTQKEPTTRKTPTQEKPQKPKILSHSPTRKDSTNSTTKVNHVTERTIQHNSPSDCSDIEIIETVIERPAQVKTPTATTTPLGRTRIVPDTVAARRNIFENNTTPKGKRPSESSSPSPVGRRPSYMEHTVSSLEHIRRDSLEVNKHNYSRKSSIESETNYERKPNSAVKFDVPQKPQRTASIPEDIDVENIFDLEVLESLLETVTSYELRRRIRAQIRLVKKNAINTNTVDKRKTETKTSKSISSTHKTSTYTSNVHHEETDTINENIKTKRPYESKTSPKRPQEGPKVGKLTENGPEKTSTSLGKTSRAQDKLRRDEEITTKTSTYVKTDNGRTESPQSPRRLSPIRHRSPETKTSQQEVVKELRRTSGSSMSTHKEYVTNEQVDYSEEKFNSSRRVEQRTDRIQKEQSRDRSYSPESKSPIRDNRKSYDVKTKTTPNTRNKSPEARRPTYQRTASPPGRTPKQRDESYNISKVTTVKTTKTRSPERKSSKPNTDENTPIWVDRKNLLKSPSSAPRKVPASPSTRATTTKSTTSKSTSQRQTQNRNFEEDSITSSYGIGPTDENGLPLFGIKALKKKKPSQPCEATEEVTGYVIEEKYYSDSKTKPKVERKEYIYSTNADELEEIKKTIEQSRKSIDDDVEIVRKVERLNKDQLFDKPEAIMPDTEDFTSTSSKYVRRGSVKELSEKFIRKESTQSLTDKSGGYPKAGLILRTSRGPSTEPSSDGYEITTEKYTTTSSGGHGYRSLGGESDDEHNVLLRQNQTRRTFADYGDKEDEQCHLSSTRSSTTKSTRSFLNSSDETKVVTSVDDALERMRNADYVVEVGDTAEDREARSLLNKFLGASVIMKGVESVLPTSKQTTTTTITKTSYADGDDDGDCDLLKNKAVKTTRITKTTKSGSSSTPVTRTTCDIEEIWDEEILKELLEQATTYEERRKIRARLRDLMAEREEKKDLKSGELSDNAPEVDESSSSEYEEIIEEVTVTDYSDAEGDLAEEEQVIAVENSNEDNASKNKELSKNLEEEQEEVKKEEITVENIKEKEGDKLVEEVVKKVEELKAEAELEGAEDSAISHSNSTEACAADKTDSKSVNDDKEQQAATSTTEKTETKEKDGAVVTTTTKVTTRTVTGAGGTAAKPVSPFAKFRQLDKQSSQQSPKSPSTPTTPGGTAASPSGSARIFQFTDPALNARAATVKEQLLQWCQSKTQEYENVQISNFSASWSDGLAFCALIHHFLPDAFDYTQLTPKNRRQNFELAFTVADEKAGIAPLLDVEDMVEMKRPDWKCVFIYVQSIYRRFRNCQ